MIVLPDNCEKYTNQHRTHGDYLETVYRDFEIMKPHLVEGSVLDIGCGLGALSVLCHRHCGGKLYLLDGTGWADRRQSYGDEMEAFNDMALTEELMRLNGVTDYELLPIGCEDIPEVDNCISALSWGWHYPLWTYKVKAKVTIADVRDKKGEVIHRNRKGFKCKW